MWKVALKVCPVAVAVLQAWLKVVWKVVLKACPAVVVVWLAWWMAEKACQRAAEVLRVWSQASLMAFLQDVRLMDVLQVVLHYSHHLHHGSHIYYYFG